MIKNMNYMKYLYLNNIFSNLLYQPTLFIKYLSRSKINKNIYKDTPSRCFHYKQDHSQDQKPVPKLLFIQNPIIWFLNKLDLLALKKWDSNFNQREFERGTRQAIYLISTMISNNSFDKLNGLMTASAINDLKEVSSKWSPNKRKSILMQLDDIKFSKPRRIHYNKIFGRKFCDIDMTFITLKWADFPIPPNTLILIEILARFHRDFSDQVDPEWTVTAFKVLKYNLFKIGEK